MNYALIGCGRISDSHIKAAVENGFNITAICDICAEKTEALLQRHKNEIKYTVKQYTDYRKMLSENPALSLVSIATDSGEHAHIALDCIDAGKNIIVEKPIAMSLADADEIIRRAEEKGVKVASNHQNRFNIAVQQLHNAIEANRFGKLSHGSVNIRWHRDFDYYSQAAWRGTWAKDGGTLMNQCIHGMDLLRWLFGNDITEVCGMTKRQLHPYIQAEDIGVAIVKFANGAVATIEGTTNIFGEDMEETLCVFGEKGTVKLGGLCANKIELWNFADENENDEEKRKTAEFSSNVYGNGHTSLYRDMELAINENRAPYVDAKAGRRALELVLAVYKSAAENKPIKLPLTDCSTTDFTGMFD